MKYLQGKLQSEGWSLAAVAGGAESRPRDELCFQISARHTWDDTLPVCVF